MKYFPLKTALACLVLAPLLYIGILKASDHYLSSRYYQRIQNIFIGNTQNLLEGRATIEKQVAENIYTYLDSDWMVQHTGLDLKIYVTTQKGKFIYPTFINADALLSGDEENRDFDRIAKENFDLLNQGLVVVVEIDLAHGSYFANAILLACLSMSLCIFILFYRMGSSKAASDSHRKNQIIEGLVKEEQSLKTTLVDLEKDRQELYEKINNLRDDYKQEKAKLKSNEEELFDEIVALEDQLDAHIELRMKKEEEIEELKNRIKKYERRKSSKSKRNEFDFISKRFSTLYKHVNMNRKAMSGLLNLNEDQQIKAEEMISMLNLNPDKVTVKRKVFSGKKHKTTCLEVLFAYNGRLYFKKDENNKIEVVVIGTKNSQVKDMEYLHNL